MQLGVIIDLQEPEQLYKEYTTFVYAPSIKFRSSMMGKAMLGKTPARKKCWIDIMNESSSLHGTKTFRVPAFWWVAFQAAVEQYN